MDKRKAIHRGEMHSTAKWRCLLKVCCCCCFRCFFLCMEHNRMCVPLCVGRYISFRDLNGKLRDGPQLKVQQCCHSIASVCVCVCGPATAAAHLSHRRPPKPSLHQHDPVGWPVSQDTSTHAGTCTHTLHSKEKKKGRKKKHHLCDRYKDSFVFVKCSSYSQT